MTTAPATPVPPTETAQTFMERCEVFFPHAECVKLSVVYKLAKFEHRAQVRKGETDPKGRPVRYFEHVRRVALILLDEAGIVDVDTISIALFHDAVEDTRLSPEEITLVSGPEVSKRVMLCSKKPKAGFRQRLEVHGDYKVLAVKVADRTDNLRTLGECSREFWAKQVAESIEMYVPLADLMVERGIGTGHLASLKTLRNAFLNTLEVVRKSR